MTKIIIYNFNDLEENKNKFKHNNAFILPNGDFILAKGYTGCNPSHQLESSALFISRSLTDKDLRKEYELKTLNEKKQSLYYLRSMLVHYYGLALFARIECINDFKNRNMFYDYSLVPNPKYYSKTITNEQIETLKKLFVINDDGTLIMQHNETNDDILKKVLTNHKFPDNWHREF